MKAEPISLDSRFCLKTPSSARERAVLRLTKPVPSDAEGTEAGDIGFIIDGAPGAPGQSGGNRGAFIRQWLH
ncbi:MAG: hypothetical protein AMJ65_00345 [Phycisphaerae bacterium SG8_4]|nr:MAG: hypothetical protein AMJ65_00345 [Phycisphaerae bacterium SG8_4]